MVIIDPKIILKNNLKCFSDGEINALKGGDSQPVKINKRRMVSWWCLGVRSAILEGVLVSGVLLVSGLRFCDSLTSDRISRGKSWGQTCDIAIFDNLNLPSLIESSL